MAMDKQVYSKGSQAQSFSMSTCRQSKTSKSDAAARSKSKRSSEQVVADTPVKKDDEQKKSCPQKATWSFQPKPARVLSHALAQPYGMPY